MEKHISEEDAFVRDLMDQARRDRVESREAESREIEALAGWVSAVDKAVNGYRGCDWNSVPRREAA
jgi:hypothetical protein